MTPEIRSDQPHRAMNPFFSFGTLTLLIIMGISFSFGITRLILGLGAVTDLNDCNPWGIWIDFTVLGYPGDPALVGGRFITLGRGSPSK
jgi:Ni/Fe-hydrogenase subunit HybB-like protein